MPTSDDLQFKELILSNKLATQQQLEECWETLNAYEEAGINKPISSIILDKGYMTLKQVNAIRQLQGKNDQYMIRGYTILEVLGQGGLGVVYKARQDSIGRIVAIKVMFPNLSNNQDYVKRFMREAKLSSELEHENIVKGIDFGESEGLYYFVMEYVEGKSLKDVIKERGRLGEKDAVHIMIKMAEALKHAECNNLIHRDIKPENIMITKEGVPKLCDLGLAKTMDENFSLTRTGVVMGTPFYISPEQAVAQKDLDIRSDIYSLGVTLYHTVTGEVPYQGDTVISIISQHLSGEIPCPKEKNPELSESLCKIIYVMMAKKREERYQSSQELIVDLNRLLRGEPIIRNSNFSAGQTIQITNPDDLVQGKIQEILNRSLEEANKSKDKEETRKAALGNNISQQIAKETKKESQKISEIKEEKESQKILNQIEEKVNKKKSSALRKVALYFFFLLLLCVLAFVGYQHQEEILSYFHQNTDKPNPDPKPVPKPIGPLYSIGEEAKKEYQKFSEKLEKIISAFPIEEIQKDMVYLPSGSVLAYSYTEKANIKHEVEAFWIDKYEVSKGKYYEFCKKTGHSFPLEWIQNGWHQKGIPKEYSQEPVTHVSFYDATLYAKYVGKRLPTNIEWEYAAKYKQESEYPWGDEFQEGYANINTGKISPVNAFAKGKTQVGIFQMTGNVWEWTSTIYGEEQENRIIKGGSFIYPHEYAKASYCDAFFPHKSRADLGFRCVFSEKK